MPETTCFPNHQGLPFEPNPPTIDGYLEPEPFMVNAQFGVMADLVDPGWRGSPRITYNPSATTTLSDPRIAIQMIKQAGANYLSLGFIIRRDARFDNNDVIVLVLHPNFATGSVAKTGDERRIHIFPNQVGLGVTAPAAISTLNVGTETWSIRGNSPERNAEYYRWSTTTSGWVAHSAATPSRPNNITIRARSWSNGSPNQYNWSIEVRIPTNIAEGGAGWINLGDEFGFYCNAISVLNDTSGFPAATQFPFPGPTTTEPGRGLLNDDGGLLTLQEIDILPSWLALARLGSSNCTQGVRFVRDATHGINIGIGPSFTRTLSRTAANNFIARVVNNGPNPVNMLQGEFRIANWGIGPGGQLTGSSSKWNLVPPDSGTNPTAGITVNPGSTTDLTTTWTLSPADAARYGSSLHPHQCVWVLLDAPGGGQIAESSAHVNMNVATMSEFEDDAEISGDGYPERADGEQEEELLLLTSQMVIPRQRQDQRRAVGLMAFSQERAPRGREEGHLAFLETYLNELEAYVKQVLANPEDLEYRYVWITDGYRRSGHTITLGGTQYRLYDAADSFGVIGNHVGPVARWSHQLGEAAGSVGRLRRGENNAYTLRVPRGERVRVRVRLVAEEARRDGGDQPGRGGDGCLPGLLRVLGRLIRGA